MQTFNAASNTEVRDKDQTPEAPSPPVGGGGSDTEGDGLADKAPQNPSTIEFQPRDLDEHPRTPVTAKPMAPAAGHSPLPPQAQGDVGYAL